MKGFFGVASVALTLMCLPLFVAFVFKPLFGYYAFFTYFLANWTILLLMNGHLSWINPISSGMDRMILGCVMLVTLSYWTFRMQPK